MVSNARADGSAGGRLHAAIGAEPPEDCEVNRTILSKTPSPPAAKLPEGNRLAAPAAAVDAVLARDNFQLAVVEIVEAGDHLFHEPGARELRRRSGSGFLGEEPIETRSRSGGGERCIERDHLNERRQWTEHLFAAKTELVETFALDPGSRMIVPEDPDLKPLWSDHQLIGREFHPLSKVAGSSMDLA